MYLHDIKLIIWDLDETFWNGTISEEDISPIEENIRLINNSLDMGIVHSICSKNEFDVVKEELEKLSVWSLFVFPSIAWSAKGQRVMNIITTMKLRPQNVLFIDDNMQNLAEVESICSGIHVLHSSELVNVYPEAEKGIKKDKDRKRLKQYKQLELVEVAKAEYATNDEFLMSCNIRVEIKHDCVIMLDRIHELLSRSNQLNFTKRRDSLEDLFSLVNDESVDSGYVLVTDKFGDYGLVGFYALKNNELIHFAFSCRILGMRIEQYVYKKIGCPRICIIEPVVSTLNACEEPEWLNAEIETTQKREESIPTFSREVLIKGPCDMHQTCAFLGLNNKVVTEFTYVGKNGANIEGHNHTSQIVTSIYAKKSEKERIISDCSFFDENMLTTELASKKYGVVVVSMFTDGNLGIYRRKATGEEIALCEKKYPLTERQNWDKYVSGEVFTSQIRFTYEMLEDFARKYEYVPNDEGEVSIQNLQKIWEYIDTSTILVLILGSEREYTRVCKPSYANRHLEHQALNAKIRRWSETKENVRILPIDKYIASDHDVLDTINHFTKRVYYDLARDLVEVFLQNNVEHISLKGKGSLFYSSIKQYLRLFRQRLQRSIEKRD